MKNIFQDHWMGRAMNLPNTPTLKEFKRLTKQKKAARKEQEKELKKDYPDTTLYKLILNPTEKDGICAGIVIDLAEKSVRN